MKYQKKVKRKIFKHKQIIIIPVFMVMIVLAPIILNDVDAKKKYTNLCKVYDGISKHGKCFFADEDDRDAYLDRVCDDPDNSRKFKMCR